MLAREQNEQWKELESGRVLTSLTVREMANEKPLFNFHLATPQPLHPNLNPPFLSNYLLLLSITIVYEVTGDVFVTHLPAFYYYY